MKTKNYDNPDDEDVPTDLSELDPRAGKLTIEL